MDITEKIIIKLSQLDYSGPADIIDLKNEAEDHLSWLKQEEESIKDHNQIKFISSLIDLIEDYVLEAKWMRQIAQEVIQEDHTKDQDQ